MRLFLKSLYPKVLLTLSRLLKVRELGVAAAVCPLCPELRSESEHPHVEGSPLHVRVICSAESCITQQVQKKKNLALQELVSG